MHPRARNLVLITSALLALELAPAAAGPAGGTVVGGSATIQGAGTGNVTVNQSSQRAIINWNTFNIGTGETTRFNQPNSSAIVLNRVTGGLGASEILGTLTANGRVFVINRDGILFGPSAVVNTAGFLATTHDIRNDDFMAGRMNFNIPGRPDASIVNQGRITATSGGFAALVAPGVRNSGTITATLGTVALAAGNSFTLDLYGDRLITLAVNDQIAATVKDVATGKPLRSLVTNDGRIRANGGRVELTAAAARTVVDSVINTSGVIKANSIGTRNGMIVLSAATGSSKGAGLPAQTVRISGTLSAAGKKKDTTGGTILVTGEHIKIANAKIDASGRAGGGKVLIGGDWGGGKPASGLVNNQSAKLETYVIPTATTVSVDANSTINASARDSGHGGKVVLWSDQQTTFSGTILARGGNDGGNGGFVETSGKVQLAYTGTVDTRAPKGTIGTLLLDPENYYINASGTAPISDPTASAISTTALVNQLNLSNVVIATLATGSNAGDIFVQNSVAWTGSNSLTLSAHRHITIDPGVSISNIGSGNLSLRSDSDANGTGTVTVNGNINFANSTGHVSIYYNPNPFTIKYENPTDYSPSVSGQFTAYMLVNNLADFILTGFSANTRGQTYALGNTIDLTGFTGFAPGTTFTGTLDGHGGLGVNYQLQNLTLSGTSSPKGLFRIIGPSGVVRNLTLTNVSITASGNPMNVGALAGVNFGTIVNVAVSGTISAPVASGVAVGGLVGHNESSGQIIGSSSSVAVTGGESTGGLVGHNEGTIANSNATGPVGTGNIAPPASLPDGAYGGLVGLNDTSGVVTNSFATGNINVIGPNSGYIDAGGLAGQNRGSITSSYATGSLYSEHSSVSRTYLGGLVGWNLSGGSITGSHASGSITGIGSFGDGGGLVGVNDGGTVFQSFATGAVSMTGASSRAGGFVGANNSGSIQQGFSTGSATVGNNNIVGGFAGSNSGTILQAYATGAASGGDNSTVGGFVGSNAGGSIDQTYAIGPVSGGSGSTVGGLVGVNGGTVTNSYWDPATTGVSTSDGGTSRTTAEFFAALPLGFDPAVWGIQPNPSYPHFGWQPAGTIPIGPTQPSPNPNPPPDVVVLLPPPDFQPQTQIIRNLVGIDPTQLASLNTNPVVTIVPPPTPPRTPPRGAGPGTGTGPGAGPGQQTNPYLPPGFTQRIFDIPPLTETRFVQDEVLLQVATIVTMERLQDAVRSLGLTLIESQSLGTTGSIAVRFRITNGQTVRDIIRQLQSIEIVAVGQPMYLYGLAQQPEPAPASRGGPAQADPAQYIVQKWRLPDVHRLVKGANVKIAVIDSEIDAGHPDLRGVIIQRFSAVGAPEKPHAHGTGMAGAIASHQRVVGTAPGARLLAVHAFSTAANAESTTYQILKGLDWAVFQGVRIINMSFAGPKDPSLERSLKSAYDKGIVLIAAAGNAGPKSPPLFPGADPNVIAVTATDADDKLFAGANRGKYVSVAAPGVDILVPAPDGAYQLTTGTSVAAAEVSGIVALLLEHNPALKPADIRRILTTSAKRLGPGERDDDFGWGLVDPTKAIQSAAPRSATTTPVRQR